MRLRCMLSAIAAAVLLAFSQVGAAQPPADADKEEKEILLNLIPKKEEIQDLSGRSVPEFYDPQNLFDYIDGQAETYLDYGFRLLITREYATKGGLPLTVEIYRLASPYHAFGIYAAERTPEDRDAKVGVDGFQGTNILAFWKGPYYCKILFYHTSPELEGAVWRAGNLIAGKIKGDYAEPELFSVFPLDFRLKRSERFIPRNFLGQSYLKDGYRVDYDREGRSYQIFLVQQGSKEEAEESFRRYQEFLRSQQETLSPMDRADFEMVWAKGEKNKVLFRYASFWGGVVEERDIREAERAIRSIVERLKARTR